MALLRFHARALALTCYVGAAQTAGREIGSMYEPDTESYGMFGSALASLGPTRLLVGAPRASNGGIERGSLYTVALSREGAPLGSLLTVQFTPTTDYASFGSAIAVLSHTAAQNQQAGYSVLAVGAPGNRAATGTVHVLIIDSSGALLSSPATHAVKWCIRSL